MCNAAPMTDISVNMSDPAEDPWNRQPKVDPAHYDATTTHGQAWWCRRCGALVEYRMTHLHDQLHRSVDGTPAE